MHGLHFYILQLLFALLALLPAPAHHLLKLGEVEVAVPVGVADGEALVDLVGAELVARHLRHLLLRDQPVQVAVVHAERRLRARVQVRAAVVAVAAGIMRYSLKLSIPIIRLHLCH